jgi:integrase
MNVKLKYIARERSGLLLYYRQIPAGLRGFYHDKIHRRQSLKTHDLAIGVGEALRLGKEDDKIWQALRDGAQDIEAATEAVRLNADMSIILRVVARSHPPEHTFSDALALYFKHHSGKDSKFAADVNRTFGFAKSVIGDPPLSKIKRIDASRILDAFLARDLKTASVRRNMAVLSAIYNLGVLEYELDLKNPFAAQKIPDMLTDAREVPSFTNSELRQIATAALTQKTTEALIPCLQIETGARISEIAMLRIEDLRLDDEIPNVRIVQHLEHARRLKTGKSSERVLPLVGVSLDAARIALGFAEGDGWLFKISHKLPSSRVNEWLSQTLHSRAASHSLRHSLETRLVRAGVDQRIVDAILGHAPQAKTGSIYFSGYGLPDIAAALAKIALPV